MDTDLSSTGAPDLGSGQAAPDPSGQAPTPIALSDDALVQLPGQEKPVKFAEWRSGLQADFTRNAQRQARELEQQKQAWQQQQAQEYQRLQQLYQQVQQVQQGRQAPPQAHPNQQLYADIAQQPYIDGKTAVTLAQTFEQGLGQVAQHVQTTSQQMAQAMALMWQQMQRMQQGFQGVQSTHLESQHDTRVKQWLSDAGLPTDPEAIELAKDIYAGYEGHDLDTEFPTIFKQRWDAMFGLFNRLQAKRVEEARKTRGLIPGKGGQGMPGKPLQDPYKPAKQIADDIWESLQASAT